MNGLAFKKIRAPLLLALLVLIPFWDLLWLPLWANPQPTLFYPPTWLLVMLPATRAVGLLLCLHLWLAGVGMCGWLRSEGADAMGALFGVVIFTFNGAFSARLCAGRLGLAITGLALLLNFAAVIWIARRRKNAA